MKKTTLNFKLKIFTSFFLATILLNNSIKAQWNTQNLTHLGNIYYENCIRAVNSNVVWVYSNGSNTTPSISRTVDGGNNWSLVSSPQTLTNWNYYTDIFPLNKDTAWISLIGINQQTDIYKTTNGGNSWTHQLNVNFSNVGPGEILHFFDANNGILLHGVSLTKTTIHYTNNGGLSWNLSQIQSTSGSSPNQKCIIGNTIWFSTGARTVWKSTDQGVTWSVAPLSINYSSVGIYGLAFKDLSNGIATNGSEIVKTNDGGATWIKINFTGQVHNFLSFVPGTTGTYISSGNAGSSISYDEGQTWITIDNLKHSNSTFFSTTSGWTGSYLDIANSNPIIFKWGGNTNTIGIEEESNQNIMNIYPNPNNGVFTIKAEKEGIYSFINELGQTIKQIQLNSSNNYTMNIENLDNGIYFIVGYNNNEMVKQKIVVTK